jgi:molybdopterin-guanine dinucleotide biosynthesis protein A
MRLLGAILAGGQSRRFGSDKAQALLDGRPLLEHVADALRPQVSALVVAGREWPGITSVADMPQAGLGPLGGLAGALDYACRHDFDAVLSSGCDLLGIPSDLTVQLGQGPAIVDSQPLLAVWPTAFAAPLVAWLADATNRSMYGFANHIRANRISLPDPVRNANRPEELGYRDFE